MTYDSKYYDEKWIPIIKQMPKGGDYRFDLREHGYKIITDMIPNGSNVFDYACGLCYIGKMLKEKGCSVSGCDFSQIAIDYAKSQLGGNFYIGDEIKGKYDFITAIYFLEHIKDPVSFVNMALFHADTLICALPNNFKKTGEHIDMAWDSQESFDKLFSEFDVKRIDEGKYPSILIGAFKHPIWVFKSKNANKEEVTQDQNIEINGIEKPKRGRKKRLTNE